jgi:hypothetical protein
MASETDLIADEVAVREEEEKVSNLAEQALWVFIHVLLAAGSWIAMMLVITMLKPESIPVLITTALTAAVTFTVGFLFNRLKQNEMGTYTWLIGLIWFLVICLWILDMPTGPNQCYHCDASQKIYLTFFSPYEDSGLIDNQGRLIGTWPTIAFVAYGIGASMAMKKQK